MDIFYVGFTNSDLWFKHFLKKGFSHCSILIPCQDSWLEVNPAWGILEFNILKDEQVNYKYKHLLRIKTNSKSFKGFPIKFHSCVKIVEYMLGKNTHSFTPFKLYKNLLGKFKQTFNTEEII